MMSLQALWSLFLNHPAQALNALALFFAGAGSWLLLATRVREQRSLARLASQSPLELDTASLLDEPGLRLNRFFYRFAICTLLLALLLSWYSTGL
ncbi:conserved hypothetical protein [Pseudomonas sp. 8AS]|nr:conserved hypothetical protein [Pseudomonas sp. 8AS]